MAADLLDGRDIYTDLNQPRDSRVPHYMGCDLIGVWACSHHHAPELARHRAHVPGLAPLRGCQEQSQPHLLLPLERIGERLRDGLDSSAGFRVGNVNPVFGEIGLVVSDRQDFPMAHGGVETECHEEPRSSSD